MSAETQGRIMNYEEELALFRQEVRSCAVSLKEAEDKDPEEAGVDRRRVQRSLEALAGREAPRHPVRVEVTQLDPPTRSNDPPEWGWVERSGTWERGQRVGHITLERYWAAFRVGVECWMVGYYDDGECFNLGEEGGLVLAPAGAKFRTAEKAMAAAEAFELNPPAPVPRCGGCGARIPKWRTHRYMCVGGGYATCFPKADDILREDSP
jgi:hypothetical protein